MIKYNRAGLYIERKKKSKQTSVKKEESTDWINVFLFALLLIVVILFVFL